MERQDDNEAKPLPKFLSRLIWSSMYGGIFGLGVGAALTDRDPRYSAILMTGGIVAICLGAALIGVRSRFR